MLQNTVPYELLVRWDHQTGALLGAHIKTFTTTTDDQGAVVAAQENPPMPVALAGAAGFPIEDILSSVHQGAILAAESAIAEKAAMEAELVSARAQLQRADAILRALSARQAQNA